MGKNSCIQGQHLKQTEWRTALELPSELVPRDARAAGVILVEPTRTGGNVRDPFEPGVILSRAGRPVLVVPDVIGPLKLRRVVVACKVRMPARDMRRSSSAGSQASPGCRNRRRRFEIRRQEESRNLDRKLPRAPRCHYDG